MKKVSQKFIYGGHLERHYGHFLTECISRLWYAAKDEEFPILWSETPRLYINKDFIDIFMNLINLDKRRFICCREPIRLREIIIPYPSFRFKKEAFSVHKLLPESVAQTVLPNKLDKTTQPLYLSRKTLLKKFFSKY